MASSAYVREAVSAQATTQVAAAYLMTAAYLELAQLWADVGSGAGAAVRVAAFVAKAAKVLALRRRQVAQVTAANLRLQRALRTGEAMRLPDFDGTPFKAKPTVASIRDDFEKVVTKYAPEALKPEPKMPELPRPSKRASAPELGREFTPYRKPAALPSEGKALREVSVAGVERELRELEASFESATLKGLRLMVEENLKRIEVAEDKAAAEQNAIVNAGQFGWVGARALGDRVVDAVVRSDPRVVAYARVHYAFDSTGPCGFCATLLSRGAVYKSKKSAGGSIGSVSRYHPNCRCAAVPLYGGEDYKTDDRFKANRHYDDMWSRVVRANGLSGREAARAFRRAVDGENRRGSRPGA